ncbi:hypothetical protein BDV97DRAFT_267631, partial [Delphinella strobiligena]
IEYYEHCPFPFNNFIYRVDVAPLSESPLPSNRSLKPGTGELPLDTSTVVVRLTNSAADGMNNHNRVENEVATMGLLRDALDPVEKHLVPHVYDWHTTGTGGQGWTVQEFMPGSSPDQVFADLSLHDKTVLISQIALVVKALQNIKLPGSVSGYGGLSFDDQGAIISSQMTLLSGGPFPAFETLMSHVLRAALNDADKSPILQGWRHIDLRSRIEAFIATGIPKVLQNNAKEMVLVQGDLTLNNLLFDKESLRLTAILDFDWAFIGTPSDEFCMSFGDFVKFPGDSADLHNALLSGSFPSDVNYTTTDDVDWDVARIWDQCLESADVQRYSTILGFSQVSSLREFVKAIAPWGVVNEVAI